MITVNSCDLLWDSMTCLIKVYSPISVALGLAFLSIKSFKTFLWRAIPKRIGFDLVVNVLLLVVIIGEFRSIFAEPEPVEINQR